MVQLIYYSTASTDLSEKEIRKLLQKSGEFNDANDITGCLLYHNKVFLQFLEGDKDIIKKLYAKIEEDERHGNITLLSRSKIEKRSFNNWSMSYYKFNDNEFNKISKELFVKEFTNLAEIAEKPTYATRMFWYMAKQLVNEN